MKIKRVILTVLDSFGIGELPDARDFGDEGVNTLRSVSESPEFSAESLRALGLGNVKGSPIEGVPHPRGVYGRLSEKSLGKDTTVGHFEMMGQIFDLPLPTFPNGFPEGLIRELEKRCGRGIVCNLPYSGTRVIEDYAEEHIASGALIVYTSADSVLQIAAHEDIIPPEELYAYCRIARELCQGELGVGRIIARPFNGERGSYKRTAGRRDFSLEPRYPIALDLLSEAGVEVLAVGKISDIYAGRGISKSFKTASNTEGIATTLRLIAAGGEGLIFTNLVDFDMLYGHRRDADGYAAALAEFDRALPSIISAMTEEDLLIVTADHGCDPRAKGTDHTREYVPLLIYNERLSALDLGQIHGFDSVGRLVCDLLGAPSLPNAYNVLEKLSFEK